MQFRDVLTEPTEFSISLDPEDWRRIYCQENKGHLAEGWFEVISRVILNILKYLHMAARYILGRKLLSSSYSNLSSNIFLQFIQNKSSSKILNCPVRKYNKYITKKGVLKATFKCAFKECEVKWEVECTPSMLVFKRRGTPTHQKNKEKGDLLKGELAGK